MSGLYDSHSALTGPLTDGKTVRYRRTLSDDDRRMLNLIMAGATISGLSFLVYVVHSLVASLSWLVLTTVLLLGMLELIRFMQTLTLFWFARAASDPVPMAPQADLRVAVLTTIVPSKEPFNLVAKTLKAMKHIRPVNGSRIDVWLLDEGNNPAIRARCEALGVHYFSRKGMEGWNTSAGSYRARTKHGNHNAWRRAHEHRYDVVAQMDPDHVPTPDFLERTLGYFADPDTGYVVAPQVYGNLRESWIARGAAFQAYVFHGIIQRGGNGMRAPLLIGTNHLYRVAAFRQIHGYQDSIIEDHLTAMVLLGSKQPNGKPWHGVYTPDIVAVGEGPTSFTDYFNQQKRWAYGIWQIATNASPRHLPTMTRAQGLAFMMLQFFYPSVAVSWLLSTVTLTLFSLAQPAFGGAGPVAAVLWAYSITSSLGLFLWLRRFNLAAHERRSWGVGGMLLLLMCIPVYVEAACAAAFRRPLTYAVTAKGALTSVDSWQTFRPHLLWLMLNGALAGGLVLLDKPLLSTNMLWIFEHGLLCVTPIGLWYVTRLQAYARHFFGPLPQAMHKLRRSYFAAFSRPDPAEVTT